MIARTLAAFLMGLPCLHDGHGAPIPRHADVVDAIATVAVETEDPKLWAVRGDVFAAMESGYRDIAGGCPGVRMGTPCRREQHAKYCGVYMIECGRVPRGASLVEQTRVAFMMMRESFAACGERFKWGLYVGGSCSHFAVADYREWLIRRELAGASRIEVSLASE